MKKFILLTILILILPLNLHAAVLTYDLGLGSGDISFSNELIEGQSNRLYAAIHNYGANDVAGYVTFYQGDILIGDSQVISVRAGGLADEVYVDWTVPSGSFNIRAEIRGQDPGDENPVNDVTITSLYVPLTDNDNDGIPDDTDTDDDNDGISDNNELIIGTDPLDSDTDDDGCLDGQDDFPLDSDECLDTDGDSQGDNADTDDDNDGISDEIENQNNTDPLNPDTDGDGTSDKEDDFPLDPEQDTIIVYNTDSNSYNTNEEIAGILDEKDDLDQNEENTEDILMGEPTKLNGPQVLINITRKDWNNYVFRPEVRGTIDNNLIYLWDFGDNTTSDEKISEHTYSKTGDYEVSLRVLGKNNLLIKNQTDIKISFFNFANTTLWVLIGSLLIFLLILIVLIVTKGNGRK